MLDYKQFIQNNFLSKTNDVAVILGTTYEARLRTKTRHGISHYSDTWQFSTWSPWTTPAPVTVFSRQLAQTGNDGKMMIGDHASGNVGGKHQWDSHNSFNSFTDSSSSLAKGKQQLN